MAKLISLKIWIVLVVYLAFTGEAFSKLIDSFLKPSFPQVAEFLEPFFSTRIIALSVWAFIALILWRPVWTFLWRLPLLGKFLSRAVFPDLNGHWEIEINSNWPIIDAMHNAAKSSKSKRFNVLSESTNLPDLQSLKFQATIEQNWFSTKVSINPSSNSLLQSSSTISVDLIPSNETDGKRLAYTYKQANKQTNMHPRSPTDEHEFFGSALLLVSEDGQQLTGKYWTNRLWDRGLNAAGLITAKRSTL